MFPCFSFWLLGAGFAFCIIFERSSQHVSGVCNILEIKPFILHLFAALSPVFASFLNLKTLLLCLSAENIRKYLQHFGTQTWHVLLSLHHCWIDSPTLLSSCVVFAAFRSSNLSLSSVFTTFSRSNPHEHETWNVCNVLEFEIIEKKAKNKSRKTWQHSSTRKTSRTVKHKSKGTGKHRIYEAK